MNPTKTICKSVFGKTMEKPSPNEMRESLFETIENQMRDGTPPETKHSFDRLIKLGYDSDEVMRRIACVLLAEIHDMMKSKRTFDNDGYVANLLALPDLPDDME